LTCCTVIFMQSCRKVTEQHVSEVQNGLFKVMVRSQEFNNLGSQDIDICVANASSKDFPDNKIQCFLNGYDFDGLSVRWIEPRVIEVSFSSGRVSHFRNSASVYPSGNIPVEFHALLCDGCVLASSKANRQKEVAHP
jgi:hypothetical protein